MYNILVFLVMLTAVALPVVAQPNGEPEVLEREVADVHRLSEPIRFDGIVDEREWQAVAPLPLVTHWPTSGEPISKRTELRLAYDDDYLYFSARCFDEDPPLETSFGRDKWGDADDQIALIIDSFDDHENAMVFALYSTGARIDAAISNDARAPSDVGVDWNTFWDGEVSRSEEGWQAEMRIPWSSLRFQPEAGGGVTMGVITYRYIPRIQEMQIFPAVPANWGFWSFVKPSQGRRMRFGGLRSRRPLYVTPYVTGGTRQEYRIDEAGGSYQRTDHSSYDVGGDLKYGITSNLTLDATINTDFAQVEADNQQVNLTRFSLFFPEKRQFFLERTSNFDFSFGGFDRVFYSRRIGLHEGGQLPLLGGLRVVGQTGGWDIGLMTMQSARHRGLPSENYGVLRLKRKVFNASSYVGGITTSRIDEDGSYNLVYGLDGVVNVTGDDYVLLNWAQSFDTEMGGGPGVLESGRLRLLWQRAREEGLAYDVGVSRAGAAYRPDLGFQLREDFTELIANAGVGWLPAASPLLSRHRLALENSVFLRNADGGVETAELGAAYDLTTRSGYAATVGPTFVYEDLLSGFSLSEEVEILPGRYRYLTGSLRFQTPGSWRLRPQVRLTGGSFFDGSRVSLLFSPTWSPSPKLKISGAYGYDRVRFPERNQRFDAHIARVRFEMTFSTRLTFSTFVQVNSAVDAVIANARFRYNPREGRDLYLVYNEVFNVDRGRLAPALPFTDSRAVIVKYSHTLLW